MMNVSSKVYVNVYIYIYMFFVYQQSVGEFPGCKVYVHRTIC